jgi:hypothetical protein
VVDTLVLVGSGSGESSASSKGCEEGGEGLHCVVELDETSVLVTNELVGKKCLKKLLLDRLGVVRMMIWFVWNGAGTFVLYLASPSSSPFSILVSWLS